MRTRGTCFSGHEVLTGITQTDDSSASCRKQNRSRGASGLLGGLRKRVWTAANDLWPTQLGCPPGH